jgi:hypothetical protein
MSRRFAIGIAIAVIFALFIGIRPSTAPAQQKEPKATATSMWEYKQVDAPAAADLSKLGEDGWEIVTVLGGQPYVKASTISGPTTEGFTNTPKSHTANTIEYGKLVYVFKRPKDAKDKK